jgi:hypothetical protein
MLVEYCEEHEGREASKLPPANEQSINEIVDELLRIKADPTDVLDLESRARWRGGT